MAGDPSQKAVPCAPDVKIGSWLEFCQVEFSRWYSLVCIQGQYQQIDTLVLLVQWLFSDSFSTLVFFRDFSRLDSERLNLFVG